jgi:hypothetical protein
MKKWIDNASYRELLERWRFAPPGDPIFVGKVGDYYKQKMNQKSNEISFESCVQISKDLDSL